MCLRRRAQKQRASSTASFQSARHSCARLKNNVHSAFPNFPRLNWPIAGAGPCRVEMGTSAFLPSDWLTETAKFSFSPTQQGTETGQKRAFRLIVARSAMRIVMFRASKSQFRTGRNCHFCQILQALPTAIYTIDTATANVHTLAVLLYVT